MRRNSKIWICGLVATVLLGSVMVSGLSADIIQPFGDNGFSNGGDPFVMGQSFKADASLVPLGVIGFSYLDSNTILPDTTVTIDLFDGLDYSGSLIDSASVIVARNLGDRFIDVDFAGVVLTAGNDYSFRLSKGAGAGGIWFQPSADFYDGGTRLDENGAPLSGDLAFRVLGVPEPSAVVLAGIGMLSVLFRGFAGRPGAAVVGVLVGGRGVFRSQVARSRTWIGLVASFLLLFALPEISVAGLAAVSQSRNVYAFGQASSDDPPGFQSDDDSASAVGFEPFHDFRSVNVTAGSATARAMAFQDSVITPELIVFQGIVEASTRTTSFFDSADSMATSDFQLTFDLSTAHTFEFDYSWTSEQSAGLRYLHLRQGDTILAGGSSPGFHQTGLLPAGQYVLEGAIEAEDYNRVVLNFTFAVVPEPSSLMLSGVGLAFVMFYLGSRRAAAT